MEVLVCLCLWSMAHSRQRLFTVHAQSHCCCCGGQGGWHWNWLSRLCLSEPCVAAVREDASSTSTATCATAASGATAGAVAGANRHGRWAQCASLVSLSALSRRRHRRVPNWLLSAGAGNWRDRSWSDFDNWHSVAQYKLCVLVVSAALMAAFIGCGCCLIESALVYGVTVIGIAHTYIWHALLLCDTCISNFVYNVFDCVPLIYLCLLIGKSGCTELWHWLATVTDFNFNAALAKFLCSISSRLSITIVTNIKNLCT